MENIAEHELEQPREGRITKSVEKWTATVPSMAYLGLAVGSMAASAALATLSRKKGWANFVGLWVPTILILGLYNKLVKIEGSDAQEKTLH